MHDVDEQERLHELMVYGIVRGRARLGVPVSPEVEDALRRVKRHLFVPGAPLEEAYADDAVVTKRDADGLATSSVSQPTIIAMMLDQLQVRPGDRILEIGSGGYNAALLRELTGPSGLVVTMDIDRDVTDRASATLAAAGYDDVRVVWSDGEFGTAECGPYDRIIVTVGAADIPPAWTEQLMADGRLVVPLRLRGLTRSLALHRVGERLVSKSYEVCGFVPMQGAGSSQQRQIVLHAEPGREVALRVDNPVLHFDPALDQALTMPRAETWTGVSVRSMEPFDDLDLWLAYALPEFSLLTATKAAVDAGVVAPTWRLGTPAIASAGTFAYRTLRKVGDDQHEFGVYAHGPDADALAARLAEQIRVWHDGHRGKPGPTFTIHPAGTPDDRLDGGLVIDRDHRRVSVSWR
ncbi:protein-L-isoaspartate(D-aspartate) O-methyltransferase [Allocatelliglobosispora scoriae]|uniref:Protein-L-isoaspartate O-methyltransferase n=2 Tax=Allocatelliglobosispora scoriae TaxID=643052 RepID=A0A841BW66_9ACTN|nr:protein-L-isoaspartate(D-aspartate) O-methyltransferase [Allocatelliglobosispora scoriae]